MAALPLRASWSALPPAVAPAPPIRVAVNVLPLRGRRCPLLPPPMRMQALPRDAFRPHCQRRANQFPEPEQEPEQERQEVDEPETDAASSSSEKNPGVLFCEKLDKYRDTITAAMGIRVVPDIFIKEKDQISKYILEINSTPVDILNLNATVLAQTVCMEARSALDVASKVMDIAALGLGLHTTEISQHTTNQMVRTYTSIFSNVAEDAYRKRVEMETIISFLDALRGLGVVCHILVESMVAKLDDDDPRKDIITSYMDTYSKDFDNKMNNLKEEFTLGTRIHAHKIVTKILFDGTKHANLYVFRLVSCHNAALPHIRG